MSRSFWTQCIIADTVLELEERIEQLFKRCLEHQITLADDKIQAGSEVPFGGYVSNDYGTKPDPTKIEAIRKFQMEDGIFLNPWSL